MLNVSYIPKEEQYPLVEKAMPKIISMLRECAEEEEGEKFHYCTKCRRPFVTSKYHRNDDACLGCAERNKANPKIKKPSKVRVSQGLMHSKEIGDMRRAGMEVGLIAKELNISLNTVQKEIKKSYPELIRKYKTKEKQ